MKVNMPNLRAALEASWDIKTSYLGVIEHGNPALGQCYPTARVVQNFFPETEIAEGLVWTGRSMEKHFWNVLDVAGCIYHIDFTWQQFPHGSVVKSYRVRDRTTLGDGQETNERVRLLRERVNDYLGALDV